MFFAVNATACAPNTRIGPDRDVVSWTAYLGSPRHDAAADESLATAPAVAWERTVGRAVRGGVAVGRDVIAVGVAERFATLLDRKTGETIWRTNLSGTVHGGPLLHDDRIFVATEQTPTGRVYALRLRDGRALWSVRTDGVAAPLTFDGGALYAATESGVVLRIRADDGAIDWRQRLAGAIRAAPLPTPAGIVVATTADTLYLLDAANGAVRARHATPGPVLGTPATDGSRVILGTLRGVVRAVSVPELATAWEVTLSDAIYGAPALLADTVVAVARDGTIALIPVAAPENRRSVALGVPVVAGAGVTRSGALIGTVAGEVLLVDLGSGTVRWRTRVRGPVENPPLVRDGQLLVVGGRGDIHTYR